MILAYCDYSSKEYLSMIKNLRGFHYFPQSGI